MLVAALATVLSVSLPLAPSAAAATPGAATSDYFAQGSSEDVYAYTHQELDAYVAPGDTFSTTLTKNYLLHVDYTATVVDPTGHPETCTIPGAAPAGTSCTIGPFTATAATAGVWTETLPATGGTGAAATWSVSVVPDGQTQPERGRVWSSSYGIVQVPGNPRTDANDINFTLWDVGRLGYVYQVDYTDFDGVNSVIQARGGSFSDSQQYRQFQADPRGAGLPESAKQWDPDSGTAVTVPVLPQLATPTVNDIGLGHDDTNLWSGDITATVGDYIGPATIEITGPGGTVLRTLTADLTDGANSVPFDGLDDDGNPITATSLTVAVNLGHGGEIHFPLNDVERFTGGLQVTALTGPNAGTANDDIVYWDDSRFDASVTPDNPGCRPDPIITPAGGVHSTGGVHTWSADPDCGEVNTHDSHPWGDQRTIDTWTYQDTGVSDQATLRIPTITVEKVVDGRVDSADQFTVGVDNSAGDTLTSATTSGTDTSATTSVEPVNQGATYTITDAMTDASPDALSFYDATLACTDGDDNAVPTRGSKGAWTMEATDATDYSCVVTNSPSQPDISVTKSVDPADGSTVTAGQVLTYTLTVTNSGGTAGTVDKVDDLSGVLDDAAVTTDPQASDDNLTVGAISGGQFEVTGTVPAAATYTVTYQVTVGPDGQRGDDLLLNFVLDPGEPLPADGCAAGDPTCTSNPVPDIAVSKSVDPKDGSTVTAGQVVTYTITFANTGKAAGTVDKVDDLSGVLDDAELTGLPTPSNNDLSVGTISGGQFEVTGTVPANTTYTVTYQVTVGPDGQRGDNVLLNFVLDPDETVPDTCAAGDPTCTNNPIPEIVPSKTVDPDSGTTVVAGQTLTYTLTFGNQGVGAGVVDYTDYLAGVLDDATVTSGPAASNAALTVDSSDGGNQLHITGTVPGNTTYTVTYQVTVKPDGQRGDNDLGNFLAQGTDSPPDHCAADDPLCTENPVPEVVPSKTVDPSSTTPVHTGEVLTYTLTFQNKGKATGTLDYVDHLADVLDDATLTGQPTASDPDVTVGALTGGGDLPITGTVPAGATYTVSYQVTIKAQGERGNDRAANFVTKPGVDPPSDCASSNTLCTTNPMPDVQDWKTVDPVSGTTLIPGQTVTYTLHFTNKGTASGEVDKVDDISQAVDDAMVVSQPKSSNGALTVTEFGSDNRAHITGTLKAGQTVTITYQLKVNAANALGDEILANFIQKPGDPPPTSPKCVPADDQLPDCTSNPVGTLQVGKTVDPASTTEVHPGDTLTYTLTFRNVGKGAAKVEYVDYLSGVLDDATVTSAPKASSDALSVSAIKDGQFAITGSVPAGKTVTVTYQVKTRPYDQQGDHDLGNFLDPPNVTPPADCVQNDPMCTVNPVPPPTDPQSSGDTGLASTGTDAQWQLMLAVLLIGAGGLLAMSGIRRRRRKS